MPQIRYADLPEALDAVTTLGPFGLDLLEQVRLAQLKRAVRQHLETYEELQANVFAEFGTIGENGMPTIAADSPHRAEAAKRLTEIAKTTCDIDGGVKLSSILDAVARKEERRDNLSNLLAALGPLLVVDVE